MLRVGVIGYGSRISSMIERMDPFDIPFRVTAIADTRADDIRQKPTKWTEGCNYYTTADEMLDKAAGDLDGIMVGTRCCTHAEMACKAARANVPLFLEKPVAITFEQAKQLAQTFANFTPPVVVSFPLRVSPITRKVRQLIEQDTIGRVEHVIAFNDVPYGRVYYSSWYREFDLAGGLWLQKATHDFDCMSYLVGQEPTGIFAMHNRRVYGGDKPNDLRCGECAEKATCPESNFNLFYERSKLARVGAGRDRCVFSKDNNEQDSGNAILEYGDGLQASYTQNFMARHNAARRGCRLYGHKGTIHLDWYTNKIVVHSHFAPTTTTIEFAPYEQHMGGDKELCYDWLLAMRDRKPSRCPMSTGINSALACLWARESAAKRQFCQIQMP